MSLPGPLNQGPRNQYFASPARSLGAKTKPVNPGRSPGTPGRGLEHKFPGVVPRATGTVRLFPVWVGERPSPIITRRTPNPEQTFIFKIPTQYTPLVNAHRNAKQTGCLGLVAKGPGLLGAIGRSHGQETITCGAELAEPGQATRQYECGATGTVP